MTIMTPRSRSPTLRRQKVGPPEPQNPPLSPSLQRIQGQQGQTKGRGVVTGEEEETELEQICIPGGDAQRTGSNVNANANVNANVIIISKSKCQGFKITIDHKEYGDIIGFTSEPTHMEESPRNTA